jgi:Protein kinase domain
VHRDVKPANILIEAPSDRVFLTDFGVVKHTASQGLTKTGFFIGTVDYAAPEQIEGLPVDARTDVYALGCVLYECLAGRAPFDRDAEVAVMHAHLTEPPPSLRSARPDLPRELDRVIASAMAKAKDERQMTCEELIRSAHSAALGRGTSTAVPVPMEAVAAPLGGGEAEGALSGEGEAPDQPESGVVEPVAVAAPSPSTATTGEERSLAESGDGSGRGSKFPAWLIATIVAVGAAAVTGIAVYLATGSDNPSTTPTDTGPAVLTDTVVTADTKLQELVEPALFRGCTVDAQPRLGASESATCKPPANLTAGQYYPDGLELFVFDDAAALAAAYDQQRQKLNLGRDFGRCSGRRWTGEGLWVHGTGATAGRRLCAFEGGNVSVIVWTHEKLGQPSHKDFLGIARQGNRDHAALFNWWDFWHHKDVGKLPS